MSGAAGDVDDQRDALLLGDLGDGRGLAGIEGADEKLGTVADQLLGARAGGVDARFGVAAHDLEIGIAEILEDRTGDIDAALAILADAGHVAGTRQDDADLERTAGGADDRERCRAGDQTKGTGARGKGAAGDARTGAAGP